MQTEFQCSEGLGRALSPYVSSTKIKAGKFETAVPSKYVNRPNSSCKENNQSAFNWADCEELRIGGQKAILLFAELCRISTTFVKKPNTPIVFLHWDVGSENIIVNNLGTAHRISLLLQMLFLPSFTRKLLFFFRSFSGTLL
jgi:hypothetical protein